MLVDVLVSMNEAMVPVENALKLVGYGPRMTRRIIRDLSCKPDAERHISYRVSDALQYAATFRNSVCWNLSNKIEAGEMTLKEAAEFVEMTRAEFLQIVLQNAIDYAAGYDDEIEDEIE